MKRFRWDETKNSRLKKERGVSFEEVLVGIENQKLLAVLENPSRNYKEQLVLVVEINDYVYYVPFVSEGDELFLKTIIPSRRLNKQYLKKKE